MYIEENVTIKEIDKVNIRFGHIYPDIYTNAMSSLGYLLVYHLMNERDDCFCERIVYPNTKSIETDTPLKDFDILNFTIHTELDYFKVIDILKNSAIPLSRNERTNDDPLIIAGGPCVSANPMPLSDFIDILCIGEGEILLNELIDTYKKFKNPKGHLEKFMEIEGLYLPIFKNRTDIRLITDMDEKFHITSPIILKEKEGAKPINKIYLDVSRGCTRGCRFCLTGYIYRPVRETSAERLIAVAEECRKNSAIDTINLIGPAVSDYPNIEYLIESLQKRNFKVSVPSMRVETVTKNFLLSLKKAGLKKLTIALESTIKNRMSMNKNISEKTLRNLIKMALELNFNLRLYFIIGFPNETEEDILKLTEFFKSIIDLKNQINENLNLEFKISHLIPKAHTPLQWENYNLDLSYQRMELIINQMNDLNLKLVYSENDAPIYINENKDVILEFNSPVAGLKQYVLSCGGSELGSLLIKKEENISIAEWKRYIPHYTLDSILPWEDINMGFNENFLEKEYEKIKTLKPTPWCDISHCYMCKNNCLNNK